MTRNQAYDLRYGRSECYHPATACVTQFNIKSHSCSDGGTSFFTFAISNAVMDVYTKLHGKLNLSSAIFLFSYFHLRSCTAE